MWEDFREFNVKKGDLNLPFDLLVNHRVIILNNQLVFD